MGMMGDMMGMMGGDDEGKGGTKKGKGPGKGGAVPTQPPLLFLPTISVPTILVIPTLPTLPVAPGQPTILLIPTLPVPTQPVAVVAAAAAEQELIVSAQVAPARWVQIDEKCGTTAADRSAALTGIVAGLSSSEALADPASAESKALDWLVSTDELILCADNFDRVSQRYTLAVMYFAMGGSDWANPWLDGGSECEWYGISCVGETVQDKSDSVKSIALDKNNLNGTLPMELFFLSDVSTLSLSNNKITGEIPEALAAFRLLSTLELDGNGFTGSIPASVYSMTKLTTLKVNSNKLSGTVSEDIGNLSELTVLQIYDNAFTGAIPWFGLSMLDKLGTSFSRPLSQQ
jgi:Leucine rich repeat